MISGVKRVNAKRNNHIVWIFLLIMVVVGAIFVKLFFAQIVYGSERENMALNSRLKELTMQPNRGIIYDAKGNALAISIECYSVYITPKNVRDSDKRTEIAQGLADVLEMDLTTVNEKIDKNSGFEYIKRRITDEQAEILKERDYDGVGLTTEYRRSYPKGTLACHVLGFAGIDNQGLSGLELYYDKELTGTPGKLLLEVDSAQNNIPQSQQEFIPAVEGYSLTLTIDETVQYITERELEKVYHEQDAEAATAIVMNVNTGAVLAMANYPNFDPNNYGEVEASVWNNFAVNGTYEPGSTFKMVSASMFLEEGVTAADDHYYCAGSIRVSGYNFKCWRSYRPHLDQTFAQAVGNSCNPVMAQVAFKLGFDKFYEYLYGFGFTKKTGIDLPGEAIGVMVNQEKAVDIDLAAMSIGQSNSYTPIQVITAISAVANGGKLMQPYVVQKITDSDGNTISETEPTVVRQVISEKTSQTMREILEGVVEEGTGSKGKVEGYQVCGKTGTAQKVVDGRYSDTDYICSYAGFAPANDPEIAVLVFVDSPKYEKMGGLVSGPVFANIMGDVLRYYQIEPTETGELIDEIVTANEVDNNAQTMVMPNVSGLSGMEAIEFFKEEGLNPIVQTQGSQMYAYLPPAGTEVTVGSDVYLYCADESQASVEIPDLTGKTIKEADLILSGAGLEMTVEGNGIAYEQMPAAGVLVGRGSSVSVKFSPDGQKPAEESAEENEEKNQEDKE